MNDAFHAFGFARRVSMYCLAAALLSQPTPAGEPRAGSSLPAAGESRAVELVVRRGREADAASLPVSSGVQLPRGAARDAAALMLLAADGRPVLAQFRPLAYWPDKSVKWVLVTCLAAPGAKRFRLTWSPAAARTLSSPLRVQCDQRRVVVDTGALRAVIDRTRPGCIDSLAFDADRDGRYGPDESFPQPAVRSFVRLLKAGDDGPRRPNEYLDAPHPLRRVTLVESGPVRAVVKISGDHFDVRGRAAAPYEIWIRFYAGQSYFEILHTTLLSGPADPPRVAALGVKFAFPHSALRFRAGSDAGAAESALQPNSVAYILQDDWSARRPALRADFRPRAEVVVDGRALSSGQRANGVIEAVLPRWSLSLCLRRMTALAPDELLIDNSARQAVACFWPLHKPEPLDLRSLSERTPQGFAAFLAGPAGARWRARRRTAPRPADMAPAVTRELTCILRPRRAAAPAGAAFVKPLRFAAAAPRPLRGRPAADPRRFAGLEAKLAEPREFLQTPRARTLLAAGFPGDGAMRRRSPGEQGWDVFDPGWLAGAQEVPCSFFLAYLRFGDERCFDLAAAMVRHILDLETLHSIARTPAAARPCRPGPDFAEPGAMEHAAPKSIKTFYCLTGDPFAREVLDDLATWERSYSAKQLSLAGLSRALALEAAVFELNPTDDRRAALAAAGERLRDRLSSDTPSAADWDAFVLPALADAYAAAEDEEFLQDLKHCAGEAWPDAHALPALAALYEATGDEAFARAAAFSLWRCFLRRGQASPRWWTADRFGLAAWPALQAGLSAMSCPKLRVAPADMEAARRRMERPAPCRWPQEPDKFVELSLSASPRAAEAGDSFQGLPWGAVACYDGVPFALPARAAAGAAPVLVVDRKTSVAIETDAAASSLHLLGGACLRRVIDSAVGCRLIARYADGEEQAFELRNFHHYAPLSAPAICLDASARPVAECVGGRVYVLTFPLKPKPLSSVRIEGGDADHDAAILALTLQLVRAAARERGRPLDLRWDLVSLDDRSKVIAAPAPAGRYDIDLKLTAAGPIRLDLDACGRPALRGVALREAALVTLTRVQVKDKLTLRAAARGSEDAPPAWDFIVRAVRLSAAAEDSREE